MLWRALVDAQAVGSSRRTPRLFQDLKLKHSIPHEADIAGLKNIVCRLSPIHTDSETAASQGMHNEFPDYWKYFSDKYEVQLVYLKCLEVILETVKYSKRTSVNMHGVLLREPGCSIEPTDQLAVQVILVNGELE